MLIVGLRTTVFAKESRLLGEIRITFRDAASKESTFFYCRSKKYGLKTKNSICFRLQRYSLDRHYVGKHARMWCPTERLDDSANVCGRWIEMRWEQFFMLNFSCLFCCSVVQAENIDDEKLITGHSGGTVRQRKKNLKLCNFPKNPIQIEILEPMGSVAHFSFQFLWFVAHKIENVCFTSNQWCMKSRRQPTRESNIYGIHFSPFLWLSIRRRRLQSWASIEYELRFIRLLNPINLSTYLIWRLKTIKAFYVIHVAMRRNHDIINNKLHLNLFVANGNGE